MHIITWFTMFGLMIGGLVQHEYLAVVGACIGLGLCCIADGLYFIGKNWKENSKNDESRND